MTPETTGYFERPSHQIKRAYLNESAADLLRTAILTGEIAAGQRVTERRVAQFLGISQAPARDALRQLESEGLLVRHANARHVIELMETDVRNLHAVRKPLEMLAARVSAKMVIADDRAMLLDRLDSFREMAARRDCRGYALADLEIHEQIWRITGNEFLLRSLSTIAGPIIMNMFNPALRAVIEWGRLETEHDRLLTSIADGDAEGAEQAMAEHMDNSLRSSLKRFQTS